MKPIKSKFLYYFLSFTWGIIMSLAGGIVALILIVLGYRPKKNLYGIVFIIGKDWGGISLGPVAIVSRHPDLYILNHEFGHSIQNCYLGPFFLFVVGIPSMARYWYREFLVNVKKKSYLDLPPYDSIWFEGSATKLGEEHEKYICKVE